MMKECSRVFEKKDKSKLESLGANIKLIFNNFNNIIERINKQIIEIQNARNNCMLLIDRAGGGKTTILCELAYDSVREFPTMLLFGKENYTSPQSIIMEVKQNLRELLSIFVDLLDAHTGHDCTLMSLQGFLGHMFDLLFSLAEKLFTGRAEHLHVLALNLHLGNARHRDGHTLLGVHFRAGNAQRHRVEGDAISGK